MNQSQENEDSAIGRRGLLKASAGLAAGVVVWTEPTIKGLARRPAYAESASGNALDIPFSFNLGRGDSDTVTVDGVTLTIARGTGGQGSDNYTISTDAGSSISISISVNNDAPTTFNGGNPLEIEVGPNGNQTYSVVGTVTCS